MSKTSGPFRILILGLPGAGKSTLAKKLAQHLDICHIESDHFFWKGPGLKNDREEFLQRISQEMSKGSFVIEGHFKDLKEILLKESLTHVLWLDPSIPTVLWRLFKRERQKRGVLSLFLSEGTFIFFLKNHRVLRNMQSKAFADFQNRIDTKSLRIAHRKLSLDVLDL